MSNVHHLPPHERMDTDEAVSVALNVAWDKVIICGFAVDSDELVVMSSHMPRESALWIAEHLKQHVLGQL